MDVVHLFDNLHVHHMQQLILLHVLFPGSNMHLQHRSIMVGQPFCIL